MSHACAAILLHLGGQQVTEDNVNKVLAAVGVTPNAPAVKSIVEKTSGKDVLQVY